MTSKGSSSTRNSISNLACEVRMVDRCNVQDTAFAFGEPKPGQTPHIHQVRPRPPITSDAGFQNSPSKTREQPVLILQAGNHKTASTYIQQRLHLNRELLKQQSIAYQDPCCDLPKAKRLRGNYANAAKNAGGGCSPNINTDNTSFEAQNNSLIH